MYFAFVVIASICGLVPCEPLTNELEKTVKGIANDAADEIASNALIRKASDAVKGFVNDAADEITSNAVIRKASDVVQGLANDAMNEISSNSIKKIASDAGKTLSEGVEQLSESVGDFGANVTEAMDDVLDRDLSSSEASSTEFGEIDANGCDWRFRKWLEDYCDAEYEKANEEAQQIEEDREKTESVCCALEDFEKCNLKAYDKANCATDKAAIRENLKAARLFLSVVGNITCTEFRGRCASYSSASVGYLSYVPVLLSSLVSALLF